MKLSAIESSYVSKLKPDSREFYLNIRPKVKSHLQAVQATGEFIRNRNKEAE